ncbi:hypothetical protein OIE62_30800 [Streptomyces scopuliridis]|uniref:Uncharacterized protein n=1 Tax=Streptomyces scopuliridis TaxID=452529 RepID=A0ACD4ZJJ6_9ACTN|nr:hypothetical protein [Streptomyces scopuliridis]WSB97336.1 hypothetical protein OG835_10135 [Streptomyces scopuliridis]WSC08961.1 hypothetical protein OIE62_30800 [Streptomyces scopuliridis]
MSGEKQPELTPEQQQAQDSALIQGQFSATDAFERVTAMMDGIGFGSRSPGGLFGKTNFEGAQLNAMLDLVESSQPSNLEDAGEALIAAKNALNKAAEELNDYVTSVEWKGESGTEFRRFGGELAKHAWALGTFANAAGTQMKVASTGLTSVRNSAPPRDDRVVPKKVEDFPLPERTDDNPEYAKAVKVEKDRQEAINQMNRLASFYAVSEESLAGQEPPKFPGMLNAAVPRPRAKVLGSDSSTTGGGAESSDATVPQTVQGRAGTGNVQGPHRPEALGEVTPVHGRDTSMEIDSVVAPPAPTTGPNATPVPPPTGTPSPSGGPVPPVAPGLVNPIRGGTSRASGPTGAPRAGGPPAGRVGQPSAAGERSSAAGRSAATGRQGVTGGGPPAGRAGGPGQTPIGRPGTTGQPAAGRAGTGGGTGPRAGRTSGIVGGTPQRSTSGSSGSRIPRGTVIGSGGTSTGRPPAGRVGQPGVIGANANSTPRPGGRGTASSNGVVGTPRGGAPGSRPGAGGFTQGGAGLVRGSGRNQPKDEEQERTGSERPEYLTEDEETWAARRRGAVPPVIE